MFSEYADYCFDYEFHIAELIIIFKCRGNNHGGDKQKRLPEYWEGVNYYNSND